MNCYALSDECWGTGWPVWRDGGFVSACNGHKSGAYKKPIVRVETHGQDIVLSHKDMKGYLERFVQEEVGHVPVGIYGVGTLGEIAAEVYAFNHDHAAICAPETPTHVFVLADLDELERVDAMLDMDIIVNMLIL